MSILNLDPKNNKSPDLSAFNQFLSNPPAGYKAMMNEINEKSNELIYNYSHSLRSVIEKNLGEIENFKFVMQENFQVMSASGIDSEK